MQAHREGRTTVAVRPEAALRARSRLFAALEEAFPVSFTGPGGGAARATISIDEEAPADGLPALVFGPANPTQIPAAEAHLADDERVDPRIRGIHLTDPLDAPFSSQPANAEVLASSGSRSVWTKTPTSTYRVASSLPELEPSQALRDLLAERPLATIAVIELLRSVSAEHAYEPPALRAVILFDDPNLRWRTYGFIDYRELLAHADAHDYHASMATIPLDGARLHRATVELFRNRPDRLSLAFHGNDHLSRELLQVASDEEARAIVAQAVRRVTRLESRSGLRVDRVMTAPHGMCSADVARALGPLGFDALCAIHPLPWSESVPTDRPLAGWHPAEFAAGCAVVPRLPLTTGATEVSLRAYLDQPLVLYGHHEDVSDGLDLLAEKAAQVNRMGPVQWCSLGEIATSNRAFSLCDGVLHVRPFSHRLMLPRMEGVESVVVEGPRGLDDNFTGWTAEVGPVHPFDAPASVPPGEIELRLAPATNIDPMTVTSPPANVWPVLRRAATETRDRIRPLLGVGSP
jgi:hypothetical protein